MYKEKFEDAKATARSCLDACPVEVIWQFFNCSWYIIDAYQRELTGYVAEWAVCQQKSHRRAGKCTMTSV